MKRQNRVNGRIISRRGLFVLIALALILCVVTNGWSRGKLERRSIECELSISLHWDPEPPTWEGTITGDIEGEFDIHNIGANFDYPKPDPAEEEMIWEFYWEEWIIETDEGTITAIQAGIWSFETFKFQSAGPVVDATGKWEYLIGRTIYVTGVSTEFPVEPPTPLTGEAELWIY